MSIVEEHLQAVAALMGSGADVDIPAAVAAAAPPVVAGGLGGVNPTSSFLHGTHEQLAVAGHDVVDAPLRVLPLGVRRWWLTVSGQASEQSGWAGWTTRWGS